MSGERIKQAIIGEVKQWLPPIKIDMSEKPTIDRIKGLTTKKVVTTTVGGVLVGVLATACFPSKSPDTGSTNIGTSGQQSGEVVTNPSKLASEIAPVKGNFGGSTLKADIVDVKGFIPNIAIVTDNADKALKNSTYASELAGKNYEIWGSSFVDSQGNSQSFVFASVLDSSGQPLPPTPNSTEAGTTPGLFFYAESDGNKLVPAGDGNQSSGGVMIPVSTWAEGNSQVMGLAQSSNEADSVPLFRINKDANGNTQVTAEDPFSGKSFVTANTKIFPQGAVQMFDVLTSKVNSEPSPAEAPTTAPTEARAVNFVNNTTPESFRNAPLGTFDFTKPDSAAQYDQVMKNYFEWAKVQAQNVQFGPDVKPVVLREHLAPGLGGKILYPDNPEAMKAIDFKEYFVTGPDGVNYPYSVYTFSLHTADGNIPAISESSHYQPAFPSNSRISVDKINQLVDKYSIPFFKKRGGVLPILSANMLPGWQDADPVAEHVRKNYPDINDRIDKASTTDTQVGNPAVLSQPGLTFLTIETDPDAGSDW